jgi:hypothetical protein
MKLREKVLNELSAHLTRFGLSRCSVCEGGALGISPYPVLVNFGGFPHEKADKRHDPDANVWYAAKVECDMCGHMQLFNIEKFHSGDDKIFYLGDVEPEDA